MMTMTGAGFDPDKDLFQAPVTMLEGYAHANFWGTGINTPPTVRSPGGGGFLLDWNLRTNLEGLYAAAGGTIYGGGCHGESHTTGRYAGRHAAEYARTAPEPVADKRQIEAEKERAYGATRQSKERQRLERDKCGHRPDYAGLLRPP